MENILIKSDANISFNELIGFLEKMDSKIIGLWNQNLLETDKSKQAITENEFLKKIKEETGISLTGEFQGREYHLSVFKVVDGVEVIIFLNSFEISMRNDFKNKIMALFNESSFFNLLSFNRDDENLDDFLERGIKKLRQTIPKSVNFLAVKNKEKNDSNKGFLPI